MITVTNPYRRNIHMCFCLIASMTAVDGRREMNNRIAFESSFHDEVLEYLEKSSVSKKRLLIPVKAQHFPATIPEKMYFHCAIEKNTDESTLTWKQYYSLGHTAAYCLLFLMYIAVLIGFITKRFVFQSSNAAYFAALVGFALAVVMYDCCLWRSCNKQFRKRITGIINHGHSRGAAPIDL